MSSLHRPNFLGGCLLYRSSGSHSIFNFVSLAGSIFRFNAEQYDTHDFHDNVSNDTDIVIPSGVSLVRLFAQVNFTQNIVGERRLYLLKNAGQLPDGGCHLITNACRNGTEPTRLFLHSAIIPCVGGDVYELAAGQNSGGTINPPIGLDQTFFGCEIIQ